MPQGTTRFYQLRLPMKLVDPKDKPVSHLPSES